MSQFVYKNLASLGHFCIHHITPVLEVPDVPNFSGQLLISIQIDSNWFWIISGIFWKIFIFVHFVHSGHQGSCGGPIFVLEPIFHLYLSRENVWTPQYTCLHAQNCCPQTVPICIPATLELKILYLPTVICVLVAWNFERLLPGTISTSFWTLKIISDVLETCSFLFILFIAWTDDIFHRISCQLLVLYTLWTFQHLILQVLVKKLPKNRVHNLVPSVYKFRIHLLGLYAAVSYV